MRSIRVLAATLLLVPALLLAQANEAAFQLESTVGLDHATCSDQAHLTLPAGPTEVVVCLTLTNNGVDTLFLHQIVSEQLGVQEPGALYTLPVNASVFYTYAARLDSSTGLVSRWESEDLLGRRYCQIAWSIVTLGRSVLGLTGEGSVLTCDPDTVPVAPIDPMDPVEPVQPVDPVTTPIGPSSYSG